MSSPYHPLLVVSENGSIDEMKDLIMKILQEFMTKCGNGLDDTPEKIHVPQYKTRHMAVVTHGHGVLERYLESMRIEEDELFNYSLQLCHWYLHLVELSDTAKEGDLHRLPISCKCNIPFFSSHSKLSKCFIENIDFVLQCEHLLSPLQRTRV